MTYDIYCHFSAVVAKDLNIFVGSEPTDIYAFNPQVPEFAAHCPILT